MRTKVMPVILAIIMIFAFSLNTFALEIKKTEMKLDVKSAVLIDANTGTVLYSQNMSEALPPASVTKIMTLLLVFEALDTGNLKYDEHLVVSEYASSMGGSQVFLEPGESISVNELLKCVVVSSANDAAVTLAERVSGSEEAFVEKMNKRAMELGMKNTHFENVTGLDDDVENHLTSAYDIALMSRELLKHEKVMEYTTIWMDTIRNGEFGLSNTNRLVKYYKGITGLKTGYTSGAGFCISASAKRDNFHLIAVIMGAKTSSERNAIAAKLLDYGFANYYTYSENKNECGEVQVLRGNRSHVKVGYEGFDMLENIENKDRIEKEYILPDNVAAPVKEGDAIGKVIYKIGDKKLVENKIIALESVEEMTFWNFFVNMFENFILN